MFLNLLTAKIIGGVAIVGLIGGVYLYISHLKSSLATLEANNVKLNFAVEQQKELIEQQNKDIIVVANYFKDYQKLNNSLNKSLNTLNEKFNNKKN